MTRKVPLNNVDHADLRVAVRHGAAFGDSVNQMLILPTEYEEAQRDFPILFRLADDGTYQSVVLLGLDLDENLFLGERGWDSRYVPAIQQRGPFSIGIPGPMDEQGAGPGPVMFLDMGDARVGDPDGHPLFLPQGGNAPYLQSVSRALQTIRSGVEAGRVLFAQFQAHGLIEPVALKLSLDDSREYALKDFHCISADRLAALDGAALAELNGSGALRAAFLVLASLANINRLLERKARKLAAGV